MRASVTHTLHCCAKLKYSPGDHTPEPTRIHYSVLQVLMTQIEQRASPEGPGQRDVPSVLLSGDDGMASSCTGAQSAPRSA